MLNQWINKNYLDADIIKKISDKFYSAKPFPHFALKNFFNEKKILNLRKEILKEKFQKQDKDLFSFSNTNDLQFSHSKLVTNFYDFVSSKEFLGFMQKLTNEKNLVKIDMHAHLFSQGDYLLFHDDVVENRNIAYILYLSKGFREKDGGRLQLYDIKNPIRPAKEIIPEFNSFVCFKVSRKSLHAVEEVYANKKRLTIGGWFYGN